VNQRTITNVLLSIIAMALVFRWWPTLGAVLVGLAVAYWLWLMWKARQAQRKIEKAARIAAGIEPFYQEYLTKRNAICEAHDPEHKWSAFDLNNPGVPQVYRDEINALNETYKGILIVKFGDSILMPKK